jgi:hypothetical protein
MRRFFLLPILVMAFAIPLWCQQPAPRDEFESRYRDGMQMEQLKLYPQARAHYLDVSRQFIRISESGRSKDNLVVQLPAVLSAVYRLGIVTARDNYFNVHPLVYQLDSFQDTQAIMDQVLIIVGDLRRQYPASVTRTMYESLYFARAYNRVAWANKLLQGTAWKNYIIAPPADLVGMMAMAVSDLDQLLLFQDLPPSLKGFSTDKDPSVILADRYTQRFVSMPKDGVELRTYRLMNVEEDPTNLGRLTAKRTLNQVYGVIEFYNSPGTQATLAMAKSNYTLDRILSKDNQPFFKVFEQMVTLIGVL